VTTAGRRVLLGAGSGALAAVITVAAILAVQVFETDFSQAPVAASLPHGGIVMYCTRWCPDCRRARVWLSARNLDFIEVDMT
jgi:hypothetical protein